MMRGDSRRSAMGSPRKTSSPEGGEKWTGSNFKPSRWSGWHLTIIGGIFATAISLIANFLLLTIGLLHYDAVRGRGLHIGVNLLSTFLITSSNSAMQCLSAPSRADVDASHARGQSVEIAISGIRNLRIMPGLRRSLWWILLLTSIPLHLFYNAVIITTMTAYSWEGFLVKDTFLRGDAWNRTILDNAWTPLDGLATNLQQEAVGNSLRYMDAAECQQTFGKRAVFDYKAVLFVTNSSIPLKNNSQPILGYIGTSDGIETFTNLSDPGAPTRLRSQNSTDQGHFWADLTPGKTSLIDHCLAEPGQQLCSVDTIPIVQAIVVFLNVLKLACFLAILYEARDQPLVTIGDAVASFLEYPDETTKSQNTANLPIEWNDQGRSTLMPEHWRYGSFWFRAPSGLQWLLTSIICLGYWFAGIIVLAIYVHSSWGSLLSDHRWLVDGFKKFDMSHVSLGTSSDMRVIDLAATMKSVVMINSFQLLLSTAYFHFNGIVTTMLLSKEFTTYARVRKGLRVSSPRGDQRLAYWLSIPYTYAIPSTLVSTALHFLLSEAFHYQETIVIDRFDGTPNVLPSAVVSAEALFILLVMSGCCLLGVVALGFRRYPAGIPLVRFDSKAISAACHPCIGHSHEAYAKLMWGVRGYNDGQAEIGFSSDEVQSVAPTSTHPRLFQRLGDAFGVQTRRQASSPDVRSTTGNHASTMPSALERNHSTSIGSVSSHVWMQQGLVRG